MAAEPARRPLFREAVAEFDGVWDPELRPCRAHSAHEPNCAACVESAAPTYTRNGDSVSLPRITAESPRAADA